MYITKPLIFWPLSVLDERSQVVSFFVSFNGDFSSSFRIVFVIGASVCVVNTQRDKETHTHTQGGVLTYIHVIYCRKTINYSCRTRRIFYIFSSLDVKWIQTPYHFHFLHLPPSLSVWDPHTLFFCLCHGCLFYTTSLTDSLIHGRGTKISFKGNQGI